MDRRQFLKLFGMGALSLAFSKHISARDDDIAVTLERLEKSIVLSGRGADSIHGQRILKESLKRLVRSPYGRDIISRIPNDLEFGLFEDVTYTTDYTNKSGQYTDRDYVEINKDAVKKNPILRFSHQFLLDATDDQLDRIVLHECGHAVQDIDGKMGFIGKNLSVSDLGVNHFFAEAEMWVTELEFLRHRGESASGKGQKISLKLDMRKSLAQYNRFYEESFNECDGDEQAAVKKAQGKFIKQIFKPQSKADSDYNPEIALFKSFYEQKATEIVLFIVERNLEENPDINWLNMQDNHQNIENLEKLYVSYGIEKEDIENVYRFVKYGSANLPALRAAIQQYQNLSPSAKNKKPKKRIEMFNESREKMYNRLIGLLKENKGNSRKAFEKLHQMAVNR